jgi:hypothetical protein
MSGTPENLPSPHIQQRPVAAIFEKGIFESIDAPSREYSFLFFHKL